ncbi:hypothetical protein PTTG_25091 [Puccinia triticina 1-1 BBBD Race 1]|uniref:Tc1-like transposase DDE domain-containing protein n=1 Tax=Puccinia triticina (isolate 1-1 / race 1 (BBBD)) TaxID=630390 RepID=A0A180H531_PUCT1|nr:hypothetical protein PTTG_25091 [Puccinia triticina 1-1 BBBD Race 1]
MGYRKYDPGTKIATVRMIAQSYSRLAICEALGFLISRQSFNCWIELYRVTQRVIRDPSQYEQKGPTRLLTTEDQVFIKELLCSEPGLFLDELQERLYDETDTLLSLTTLHRNLIEDMEVTLKKANTVNIKKSLVAKHEFIERMATVPAEYLVFSDESLIFSKDLLQTYSCSTKGNEANRTISDPNATRFTLIPAIGFNGLLEVTVTDENVKGRNFAHFLKYSLVKSDLRRSQALVQAADPKWEIERTAYQVILARLCQKLFRHAGYLCPDTLDEPDLQEYHFCE